MLWHYHASFMYYDLCELKLLIYTYRECVRMVTMKQFAKLAIKIPDTMVHRKDNKRSSWIVPALNCYMCYINEARSLPGNRTTDKVKRSNPRQSNVSFVHILSTENRSELKLFDFIATKAIRDVDGEAELYFGYGRENTLPNITSNTESK